MCRLFEAPAGGRAPHGQQLSLSMVFDGGLRESCARNLRVALSDRETSLMEDNGQLGSCRDSMRTENEAH